MPPRRRVPAVPRPRRCRWARPRLRRGVALPTPPSPSCRARAPSSCSCRRAWHHLDPPEVPDPFGHVVEDPPAKFGMLCLPEPEHDRHLHLVTLAEELLDLAGLRVEVAVPDLAPVLHFLARNVGALAAGVTLALGLLVLPLAVVHDPADRGVRLSRHLDEVEVEVSC